MLEDIIKERLKKRQPEHYPARVKRTHRAAEVLEKFSSLEKNKKSVTVAGRIMGLRVQGGVMFWDIQDESGKIQAVIKKDTLENFADLKERVDIGDFVEIGGPLFKTKKGEKSVDARNARIIAKSLRPLPSVWHGLKDVEERFRNRYLDILLNPEVKEALTSRSRLIEYLRNFLTKEEFLEVETPMLQPIAGGARAKPFVTHHNALDADFYLRIAPELYLKRLLVGGLEKVFEIGRNFRNEGIDRDHNPEFTMLELYWAYQDYQGLMKFTEKLLAKFIPGKWGVATFTEIYKKYVGRNWKDDVRNGLDIDKIFKDEVRLRGKIEKTSFVIDYPAVIMPLAKFKEEEPELTESFQLIAGSKSGLGPVSEHGAEVVKGFSEMNDPVLQRKQMEEQEKERLDEDFLEALEYGMPPAAGLGIGIDRLAALITRAHSLKEIIIFPTLKSKE